MAPTETFELDDYIGKSIYWEDEDLHIDGVEYLDWSTGDDDEGNERDEVIIEFESKPYDDSGDGDDGEYDETRNWSVVNSLSFLVDEENKIISFEIDSRVSAWGDSGLGDCDPEEHWTEEDYLIAKKALDVLTTQKEKNDI